MIRNENGCKKRFVREKGRRFNVFLTLQEATMKEAADQVRAPVLVLVLVLALDRTLVQNRKMKVLLWILNFVKSYYVTNELLKTRPK